MQIMTNNQTLDICPDDHRYDHLLQASLLIWRFFGFTAMLVGTPGNLMHIVILGQELHRKDPLSIYMIAISICDLVFLSGGFWFWSVTVGLIQTDPRQVFSCGIFHSFIIGSSALSNIYLALMCIDRSVMILWPVYYRIRVTQSKNILKMIIVGILMIISLIPNHFYLYYDRKTTIFLCEFRSSVNRPQVCLWSFINAIVYISIPMLIVCISSFILLVNRYRHHQLHKKNQSLTAVRMLNRSIILVFISIGLGASIMPACIVRIFLVHDQLFAHDDLCSIRWKIYKILFHCFLILSTLNYSMKFYIHLIISTSFRERFVRLITCQTHRNRSLTLAVAIRKDEEKMIPLVSNQSEN